MRCYYYCLSFNSVQCTCHTGVVTICYKINKTGSHCTRFAVTNFFVEFKSNNSKKSLVAFFSCWHHRNLVYYSNISFFVWYWNMWKMLFPRIKLKCINFTAIQHGIGIIDYTHHITLTFVYCIRIAANDTCQCRLVNLFQLFLKWKKSEVKSIIVHQLFSSFTLRRLTDINKQNINYLAWISVVHANVHTKMSRRFLIVKIDQRPNKLIMDRWVIQTTVVHSMHLCRCQCLLHDFGAKRIKIKSQFIGIYWSWTYL